MGLMDFLINIFTEDSVNENEHNEITVDINQLGWSPDTKERVLVAHADCKIMKNEGRELGEALGKVHFIAQEDSLQRLVCCVTDRRMLIIPQDNKEQAKIVFSIGSKIMGVDWASRKIASSILFNNWLEFSVEFSRVEIESAKLSDIPDGNIVIIRFKNNKVLYLSTADIGHSMDIVASIMRPEFFMN